MKIRTLKPADLESAGMVLFQGFERAAQHRGYEPPWSSETEARALVARCAETDPELMVIAEEGGAVVGVGAARLRGEIGCVGPIAALMDGRGIGGAVLDGLLERLEDGGAAATRLYVDAWNANAYGLYAGRGFGVVDVVAHVERAPGQAPELISARGLEVRPMEAKDMDELERFDTKLTGHERRRDLAALVRFVARRRGAVVGYLGSCQREGTTWLGPAVAVDTSDLFTLITCALNAADKGETWMGNGAAVHARLSTSTPGASPAALGLGFRVRELGVRLCRGAPPPARPSQLYSMEPEVL